MGYSQFIEPLPGGGYGGNGIDALKGQPIFVGRNRSLSLTLDVTDAPSSAAVSVYIETASSQFATRWRKLAGSDASVTGIGTASISATGADAFIRARYIITLADDVDALGLSLTGQAQCILQSSQSITAAGTSATFDLAQYHGGRFAARVIAAPVGQTIALIIERSGDGQSWATAASFASITTTGEFSIESADLDRFVRVKWTPSAGGTWTFGVAGTSHLIYAHARDRGIGGIRGAAIPDASDPVKVLFALISATKTIVSYYTRYDHPLRAWGEDTIKACVALGDWELLNMRSKDPARINEGGGTYVEEAQRWTAWLERVAGVQGNNGYGRKLTPADIIDSAPTNDSGETKRWSFESTPNPWGQGNGYGGGV